MTTNAKDAVQSAFLQRQPIKMLIGGQWVEAASGETFETINPSTGEVLARVAAGANEDINRAVAAARKAFESGPWPKMTASQRGRLFVHSSVYDQVLSDAANKMKVGVDPATELGPLVSQKQLERVTGYVESGKREGATAPFGGYKQSGYGREMGHAVLDAYTQIKTVWVNLR